MNSVTYAAHMVHGENDSIGYVTKTGSDASDWEVVYSYSARVYGVNTFTLAQTTANYLNQQNGKKDK